MLAGPLLGSLQDAILATFSRDELRLLLRNRLDASFDAIVSETSLTVQAYELLAWADRQDRVEELLSALLIARPNNAELQAVAAVFRSGFTGASGPDRGPRRRSNVPLQRPPRVQRFTGRQAKLA